MNGSLRTADGIRLSVRRWPARAVRDDAVVRGEAVVLVHGFGSSKNHRPVVAVARHLAQHGYDVVTYDARGHGASGGVCTLGELEPLDVAAAVALARSDSDRVVAVGASMGAIGVLRHAANAATANATTANAATPDAATPDAAAAQLASVDAVVSLSSPATWSVPRTTRGIASIFLTRTSAGRRLALQGLHVRLASRWSSLDPPADLVARLSMPVSIVHGLRDRFIRPADARTLYERARDPRRLDLVPDMGHAYDAFAIPAVLRSVRWALDSVPSVARR